MPPAREAEEISISPAATVYLIDRYLFIGKHSCSEKATRRRSHQTSCAKRTATP
jgi:hypothetical protein